ncbi:MAG: rRNA pseudouridine synthase [Gammaproteobacteria bacterium]|nr:rRNA pseudouridine synthase [Gammaproteobacteria bacterium]MYC26219.1 rRNA pseudouridine synthase [Gammaproteobacteria bacterium]
MSDQPTQKLQKFLADQGLGSRREMERCILEGQVTVNGKIAHQGQRIGSSDRVEFNGKRVTKPDSCKRIRVLILNKAPGQIVSRKRDSQHRVTVFDQLPKLVNQRWISVGRLDVATSGLLLITNNGLLAHRLMHPSFVIDREYAVRVFGTLSEAQLKASLEGVELEGVLHRFSDIQYYGGTGSNHWYHVVLMEGRNREIRIVFERLGLTVSRLKRVRFGPVILPTRLRTGKYFEASPADVELLAKWLKIDMSATLVPNSSDCESCLIDYPGITKPRSS